MNHMPDAIFWVLVTVSLLAPPASFLAGGLAGAWLWHRATTGNRSPLPLVPGWLSPVKSSEKPADAPAAAGRHPPQVKA